MSAMFLCPLLFAALGRETLCPTEILLLVRPAGICGCCD